MSSTTPSGDQEVGRLGQAPIENGRPCSAGSDPTPCPGGRSAAASALVVSDLANPHLFCPHSLAAPRRPDRHPNGASHSKSAKVPRRITLAGRGGEVWSAALRRASVAVGGDGPPPLRWPLMSREDPGGIGVLGNAPALRAGPASVRGNDAWPPGGASSPRAGAKTENGEVVGTAVPFLSAWAGAEALPRRAVGDTAGAALPAQILHHFAMVVAFPIAFQSHRRVARMSAKKRHPHLRAEILDEHQVILD
jgi:hypothetical protein